MVRVVTEELRNNLIKDREKGMTYSELMKKYNISKWTCTNYLRDIKPDRSYVEKAWRLAEKEAVNILTEKGFKNILNLNSICQSPYWDYYAEKNGRWLIDVTINGKKSIVDKYSRVLKGYICAILHKKDDGSWSFVKLETKEL